MLKVVGVKELMEKPGTEGDCDKSDDQDLKK